MFRLHSLIHAGPTLMTAFRKSKYLSSLNIRSCYYYCLSKKAASKAKLKETISVRINPSFADDDVRGHNHPYILLLQQ